MPRQPKPYLRKQTKSWYCSIGGRQISLGKDRDAAFEKFYELMGDREQVRNDISTLYELSQVYLDWCQENRKPGTYENHRRYLKRFILAVGKRLRPHQLKKHQITKWLEGMTCGSTSKNDAVSVVQRMLNWAVEQDYLSRNPIKGLKKPRRERRDVFYTEDQWKRIRKQAQQPFLDLLDFLHLTGCRPVEARSIEARHLHGDLVIFPADESKGEREPRVIYLVPQAKKILDRLLKKHSSGILFRNSQGKPWTKNAIVLRMRRIGEKTGFRVIAYGARHSYATTALAEGGIDPISVAHLMGHRDTTMVSRVYSHLAQNPDYLRKQAKRAIRKASPTKVR